MHTRLPDPAHVQSERPLLPTTESPTKAVAGQGDFATVAIAHVATSLRKEVEAFGAMIDAASIWHMNAYDPKKTAGPAVRF